MEEAAACDGIRSAPDFEYAVHINAVREEVAVLVVTLTGTTGTKDGGERGEIRINCFKFST